MLATGLAAVFSVTGFLVSGPLSATECLEGGCTGTVPAIWPERSATNDGTVRVLGWNLLPDSDYAFIVWSPDQIECQSVVRTDAEGDILGNDYDLSPEERALLDSGQPFECLLSEWAVPGLYEIQAFEWAASTGQEPVAGTTLLVK